MLPSQQDLSTPTMDQTWPLAVKVPGPNHRTTREFPLKGTFEVPKNWGRVIRWAAELAAQGKGAAGGTLRKVESEKIKVAA